MEKISRENLLNCEGGFIATSYLVNKLITGLQKIAKIIKVSWRLV